MAQSRKRPQRARVWRDYLYVFEGIGDDFPEEIRRGAERLGGEVVDVKRDRTQVKVQVAFRERWPLQLYICWRYAAGGMPRAEILEELASIQRA